MRDWLKKLKEIICPLDFTCDVCKKEMKSHKHYICLDCYEKLPFIKGNTCLKCGEILSTKAKYCMLCQNNKRHFVKNFSVFNYTGSISMLLHRLKYYNERYLGITLGNFLIEKLKTLDIKFDLIIPIPLHKSRKWERTYNQTEELCKQIIEQGYPFRNDIVIRVKDTEQQTKLSLEERKDNLHLAFGLNEGKSEEIKGKTILLVDDVFTTGTTLDECAKFLNENGAKAVYSLTLAHTINEKPLE